MLVRALTPILSMLTLAWSIIPDIGPMATVARCRVSCIEQTMKNKRGEDCQEKTSCSVCWEFCYYLMVSPNLYSLMCRDRKKCRDGCKTACLFRSKIHDVPKNISTWRFTEKPAVLGFPRTQKIDVMWSRPTPVNQTFGTCVFVYLLMAKEKIGTSGQDWTQIVQTAKTDVLLKEDNLPRKPEFWLLAVNHNGTVADVRFNATSTPIKEIIEVGTGSQKKITPGKGESEESPIYMNATAIFNKTAGTMNALIEWEYPPIKLRDGDTYTIHWFLNDCEVYDMSPQCDIHPDHFANTIFYKSGKKPYYIIPHLVYNALYTIRVEFVDKWYGELYLYTEFCSNVDEKTYTVCADVDISSMDYTEENLQPQQTIASPLLYNLNLISCKYDSYKREITAEFNWTVPFNQSYVEVYIVRVRDDNTTSGMYANIFPTDVPKTTLTFKPYRNYDISVEANYISGNGEKESQISSSFLLNTSWVDNMPQALNSQSLPSRGTKWKVTDAIAIGITLMVSIALIGLMLLFIYKKRHTFKDIIIPKTAVAKSNSYKSNVGCKVDYSNQLLVMTDEWELDPPLLKFSSPIGQGAFGKVVTGYYADRKVAIKLIRDSAPLSYKEDLLAEINLMKRIGSHPNIVSMTGACTLSEPIALVMEYVPYGNLQNFLKKCRLEGEFQRPIGRPSEVVYSMMDSSGGIDSGVITPADMLSFARQVAMAMEYLSAKKYVHRDLAARNVLLGYDKIVKVCDFGLSRDIYNDNMYHKVTSGKLPLKWMAIESLRDRIFTTQSDIWSFGILMWEIITMGGSPYPNIALADLYYVLANGYRMEKTSNCSDELYIIMRQCWMECPNDRPSFTELRVQIEQLLSRDRNYLELDNIDVPLSTSDSSSAPKSEDSDTLSLISNGPIQHRKMSIPPLQHTSRNIAHTANAGVCASGGLHSPEVTSPQSSGIGEYPVTVVSIEKSSLERLIKKQEGTDQ